VLASQRSRFRFSSAFTDSEVRAHHLRRQLNPCTLRRIVAPRDFRGDSERHSATDSGHERNVSAASRHSEVGITDPARKSAAKDTTILCDDLFAVFVPYQFRFLSSSGISL
jgi:hypothetical protein